MANVSAPAGRDVLRMPVLGHFLRWRHARTTLQVGTLAIAAAIILDGLFGPSLAPRNLAGTIPWVHWRGFVVLGLLAFGNLFCMACPFMLPRRLAKRFGPARLHWPAPLRSKWVAVALLALFFWAYEAFALWSSPWLTAWVALAYFALAFTIDGFFKGAAFCKHVCPIGQFHFVNGVVSPTEVRVRDPQVCADCRTLDCIRGRYAPDQAPHEAGRIGASPIELDPARGTARLREGGGPRPADAAAGRAFGRRGLIQSGCELALFQPRKHGNGDCTYCLDCIHACPHDNVGIVLRAPGAELSEDPVRSGIGRLSRRADWAALAVLLTFGAFVNAFGMTEPAFQLRDWGAAAFGVDSPPLVLLGFFAVGLLAVPAALSTGAAWASRALAGGSEPLPDRIATYAWALVPLGFGMWTAHYLFHLLSGGLALVPLLYGHLTGLGVPLGDVPSGALGSMVPEGWLLPIEALCLQVGLFLTLVVGFRIARREAPAGNAWKAFLPWAVLATLLALAGLWMLTQPMEMRGTMSAL